MTTVERKIQSTDRFGWFWYTDTEIFESSQKDIDEKMAAMAAQGITHIITFSPTHFRWSYKPWWPQINECLRKVVVAAHKLGIKVIEHHSSHLTSYPATDAQAAKLENQLKTRRRNLKNYPGIIEYLRNPSAEELSRRQLNGATGELVTPYDAHGHCFNNQNYVDDYLKYLETVYATGVDGIMTDDVQLYGLGQACACPVCRRKFTEQTGYQTPEPASAEWQAWYGNLHIPSFAAWVRFRAESLVKFHVQVKEHYEKLGLELLRPNYSSNVLGDSLTGVDLDTMPQLDMIFQECCYSSIIRYSYPAFLDEQQHRQMLAEDRNCPHMMMFYANNHRELRFAWGVARLAGAGFTNTAEVDMSLVDETELRNFEKRYASWLFDLKTLPAVGFLDFRENRIFGPHDAISRLRVWMQSCRLSNIPIKLCDIEHPELWTMDVLVLNETAMVRDRQLADLRKYAEAGGTLIVSGEFAVIDENYRPRPLAERADFAAETVGAYDIKAESVGSGKIVKVGYAVGFPGSDEFKKQFFINNPQKFTFGLDLMEIISQYKHIRDAYCDRHGEAELPQHTFRSTAGARQEVVKLMNEFIPQKPWEIIGAPELLLASTYETGEGNYVIHLLNACGTLNFDHDKVTHSDPIPFPALSGQVRFKLRINAGDYRVKYVELPGESDLTYRFEDDTMNIELDLSKVHEYGAILIEKC